MAYYIQRLTEEKTIQSEIVSNLNGQIVNLETTIDSLQENLNILSNTIENNAENNSNENSSTTNDTSFVQGTDEYYTVTLDDTVKLKLPDDSEETINTTTLEMIEDNNFINLGVMYDFEFDNGKLSKIIYMM